MTKQEREKEMNTKEALEIINRAWLCKLYLPQKITPFTVSIDNGRITEVKLI